MEASSELKSEESERSLEYVIFETKTVRLDRLKRWRSGCLESLPFVCTFHCAPGLFRDVQVVSLSFFT